MIELGVLNVESLSSSQGFPCGELGTSTNWGTPVWYTTLWVLARYAATKRLNEHLRTPQQSRVNRTWLILSRKICEGKLPRSLLFFFPLLFLFFIMLSQTRSSVSYGMLRLGLAFSFFFSFRSIKITKVSAIFI